MVYTVQLEDADGAVTAGTNGLDPAQYTAVLVTHTYVGEGPGDTTDTDDYGTTALSRVPMSLTTDSDGKVTITISAPDDPAPREKTDKFRVTLTIAAPGADDNAPSAFVDDMGDPEDLTTGIQVVFSTEPGVPTERLTDPTAANASSPDITVIVKAASGYAAAATRGASNRATVTVIDQYGDPIAGGKVTLTSSDGTVTDGGSPTANPPVPPALTPGKSTLMATSSAALPPLPRQTRPGS